MEESFTVGEWQVEPSLHTISRNGESKHLEPKVMALLVRLARRPGAVVEKDILLKDIWPDVVVSEVSLPRSISELRRALGDDAREPSYIQTIPKKGYRLVAQISPSTPVDVSAASRPGRRATLAWALIAVVSFTALWFGWQRLGSEHDKGFQLDEVRSLAVLPLRNLSGDRGEEYFVDSMTELLITDLARLGIFRVISTPSVMAYRDTRPTPSEIASELGVDALLDGSVLRTDDGIRVTVQLVDPATGEHVWGDSYSGSPQEALALQGEVAASVAGSIQANLPEDRLAEARSRSLVEVDAYDYYLKGRHLWRQRAALGYEGVARSIPFFQRALELDPDNALAWSGLSDAHIVLAEIGGPQRLEQIKLAREAALRALQLDDGLAEAHVSLGMIRYRFELDWDTALDHFQLALSANPGYATGRQWFALFLAALGRLDEAERQALHAVELDPLSSQTRMNVAWTLYLARNFDGAAAQVKRAAELDPRTAERAQQILALIHAAANPGPIDDEDQDTVERALRSCLGREPEPHEGIFAEPVRRRGMDVYCDPGYLATLHVILGELEEAALWLEESTLARSPWLVDIAVDPIFDPLRGDPRFQAVVDSLNLPSSR